MSNNALGGVRVLVVEDEFLIAMDVEQLCRDAGAAEVVIEASAGSIDLDAGFDLAVVDVMAGDGPTVPLAEELAQRRIPFVFATGYLDTAELAARFPNVPVVSKPYSGDELIAALVAARSGSA